jgi:hypothetical protein
VYWGFFANHFALRHKTCYQTMSVMRFGRFSRALVLLSCTAFAAFAPSSDPNKQSVDTSDSLFVKRLQEISARGGSQVVNCGFTGIDAEGKRILPVPLKLVRDAKFERFEKAVMTVAGHREGVPLITDSPEPRFVTGTFIGRIDAVSKEVHEYLQKQPVEKRIGLGFGQMGSFEAQFTLESVEDDATLQ